MNVYVKPEFGAKFGKFRDPCLGIISKPEVASLMQGTYAQGIYKNPLHKLPGIQGCQSLVEVEHQHRVDACGGQQANALIHRCQQLRRLSRTQELLRVRIEGDGDRARAASTLLQLARFRNHCGEYLPVPQMHAVEVPNHGHSGAESGWNLPRGAIDGDHAGSTMAH